MTTFLEALMANFIFPAATVLFPGGSDWLTGNFSVLGGADRRLVFFLWGSLAGLYFYYFTGPLAKREETVLLNTSGILLALAVLIPYLPGRFPVRSALHVAAAFSASVCYSVCLLTLILRLEKNHPGRCRIYLLALASVIALCAFLFFAAGIISSAMEVLYTVSSGQIIHRLHRQFSRP